MSFKDKMLAANGFNVGRIESPDFPCGKIIVKNDQLVIINAAMGKGFDDYEIHQENILVFKLIACGNCWCKYLIIFKDGKSGYVTQEYYTDREKKAYGMKVSMSPIERYLKFVDYQMPVEQGVVMHKQEKSEKTPVVEEKPKVQEPKIEEKSKVIGQPVEKHLEQKAEKPKEETQSKRITASKVSSETDEKVQFEKQFSKPIRMREDETNQNQVLKEETSHKMIQNIDDDSSEDKNFAIKYHY